MGMLDYGSFDTQKLIQDTMDLYLPNVDPIEPNDGSEGANKIEGWRYLVPEELNYAEINYNPNDSSYHGETDWYWGVQTSVLGKFDSQGNMTSIGLKFWGTGSSPDDENAFWNTLSDVLSYGFDILGPANSIHSYVYNAFNNLLTQIVNLACENGLSGKDIIFTGHSQGGLCVNSMASASALGKWDGFFEDSAYIALASPTQNNLDDKVLNIGLENDPVFKVAENDNLTIESLFVHDKPLATCTNNLVSFNDYYTENHFFSILNIGDWEYGHSPSWYASAINTILYSDFYSATNLNSTIIVASLSDNMREKTWVEDLNYSARAHVGPTFILGSDQADLIKGGSGIDYLEGNGGDDIFRDAGGYNVIFGGEGTDTFDTGTQFDFWSYGRDLYGNIWAKDLTGNVSVLNSVENIKGGFSSWWQWHEINGSFTVEGVEFSYDNVHDFRPYSTTAHAGLNQDSVVTAAEPAAGKSGFLFGYMGNDTLIGTTLDEVFAPGQGDDIIATGGGKDTIIISGDSFGHDTLYQFGTDDKLVFLANSQIESQDSLYEYMSTIGNDLVFNFNAESSITLLGAANLGLDHHQLIAA